MVNGKRGTGLTAELSDGRHQWLSGELPKIGGKDEGPSPHELLESALGACTILTLQLYAERKGWPLEGAEVNVEIVQEGPEQNKIRREIRMTGALSDEQRARLLEIADRCPIHRFLSRVTEIETAKATE
jgi:putative redox protein